jgi:uncharacterized protein (DUF433 family)
MTTPPSNAGARAIERERIVCTPGTCGGRPRIAGPRIRVQDVYFWHVIAGKSADEIVSSFPELPMADIYAALSHFWTHRDEILADIQRQRLHYEEMKRTQPSLVAEKLKRA